MIGKSTCKQTLEEVNSYKAFLDKFISLREQFEYLQDRVARTKYIDPVVAEDIKKFNTMIRALIEYTKRIIAEKLTILLVNHCIDIEKITIGE